MARFEHSRERKRDSRGNSQGGRSFEDSPRRGRDSGRGNRYGRDSSNRGSNRYGRERRDVEMTKVTCSSCGAKCEVPFKPTSSKPVYCNDCYGKQDKGSSNNPSNKDLDIINEKLNKIMKALKIE